MRRRIMNSLATFVLALICMPAPVAAQAFPPCDQPDVLVPTEPAMVPGTFPDAIATINGPESPVAPRGADGPVAWHVSPDGDDDTGDGSPERPFRTIQRAVDAASAGQAVVLGDGEYSGPGNVDVRLEAKAIKIRSQSGNPTACVIECGSRHGFVFQSKVDGDPSGPHFAGLTIKNASHGIRINVDSGWWQTAVQSVIDDCRFINCVIGVKAIWYVHLTVRNSRFIDNGDAGISHGWPSVRDAAPTAVTQPFGGYIADCEFRDNGSGYSGVLWAPGDWIFERSVFAQNQRGVIIDLDGSVATFEECRMDSNTVGLVAMSIWTTDLKLNSSLIRDNATDGIRYICELDGFLTLSGCQVTGNHGHGILWRSSGGDGYMTVQDTEIVGNGGWGVRGYRGWTSSQDPIARAVVGNFVRSRIDSNLAGGIHDESEQHVIRDCIITNNGGDGLRIMQDRPHYMPSLAAITATTIANNAGVGLASDHLEIHLERVLIAGNAGPAVELPADSDLAVSCTNLHGNAGGDWVEPIADRLGQDGNLAVDPRFCDATGADFTVLDISPCLPGDHPDAADCGPIGALGAGCFAAPRFLSLADVPHDQGGQIRLTWAASHLDRPGVEQPVVAYGVYRRQDDLPAAGDGAGAGDAPLRDGIARLLGWDYLTTVPGRGDEGYQVVAPSLCDSTDAWDPDDPANWCWSVFMVSAMTADSFVYYDSAPDSGYSADNLAPDAPAGLAVSYDYRSGHRLSWLPNTEPDLREYRVYRGTAPDFPALPGKHIARTTAAAWSDTAVAADLHYQVAAVDRAGNVGEPASPHTVTSAPVAGGLAPARTALLGAHPNPFNPATTISFELARRAPVTVRIYDLAGRLVRELVSGEVHDAGRHAVVWQGRDRGGRVAASGRYLCRFEADQVRETRSLLLLK